MDRHCASQNCYPWGIINKKERRQSTCRKPSLSTVIMAPSYWNGSSSGTYERLSALWIGVVHRKTYPSKRMNIKERRQSTSRNRPLSAVIMSASSQDGSFQGMALTMLISKLSQFLLFCSPHHQKMRQIASASGSWCQQLHSAGLNCTKPVGETL